MRPDWGSFSYLFGPLLALAAVGVLVLVLRWATQKGTSVVGRPARSGPAGEYGLLVPVAAPPSTRDGEGMRFILERSGVRATLAATDDGLRILVFPHDEARARLLLGAHALPPKAA